MEAPMTVAFKETLEIRQGDTYQKPFGWVEDAIDADDNGGRDISDLIISSGDTAATSLSARFSTNDNGKKIAVADGNGITDGTTMTYVSPTQVTLSAPATADRSNVLAFLRPLNLTAYTDHKAEIRSATRAHRGRLLTSFTIDVSRAAVGIYWFSLSATETLKVVGHPFWDWQVVGPQGSSTWHGGDIDVDSDVTQ
jgi:hypothetical protein